MNLFSISDISFKPSDLNECKNVALLAVLVPPISSSACFRFLALLDLRPCSPHYQTSPCLDTAAMVGQKAPKFVFPCTDIRYGVQNDFGTRHRETSWKGQAGVKL